MMYENLALPVNEYLDAVIIIQLSIKLPLLAAWHTSFACPKQVSRKRHPTMPALRAPLRCSPVAGRQKLADAQTGLASCSTTGCAAQRHRMGNSTRAHTCPGTRYPDDPHYENRYFSSSQAALASSRFAASRPVASYFAPWSSKWWLIS